MKKHKPIYSAMAGLYAAAGLIQCAEAANLNPGGTGQALIYPYYTVNNDLNTLLSVVNTRDEVKAVKLRFLESDNGQSVLDFNLYLAPFDVWTAALSATGNGAELATADNSCTPFLGNPQPFLRFSGALEEDPEEKNASVKATWKSLKWVLLPIPFWLDLQLLLIV